MRSVEALERDGHALARRVAAARRGRNGDDTPRIIRFELSRRSAHDVEIEIMHARLIENDVREFRQAVFDVLDPAAADDVRGPPVVRLPERRLVDPAGLLENPIAEAEGLEHLHRPAGDAVGLAVQHSTGLLFDDGGLDVGKRRQLRRKRQPRGSGADDEDVDLLRDGTSCAGDRIALRRVEDLRVARLESIEVKLHDPSLSFLAASAAGTNSSVY